MDILAALQFIIYRSKADAQGVGDGLFRHTLAKILFDIQAIRSGQLLESATFHGVSSVRYKIKGPVLSDRAFAFTRSALRSVLRSLP